MDLDDQRKATDIERSLKPEESELNRKRAELDALEAQLVEQELRLETLTAEMRAFEARYLSSVGVKYARLDEIGATIAEAAARLRPSDVEAAKIAAKARMHAEESAHTASAVCGTSRELGIKPSEDLSRLYRAVARKIHPDLCTDEQERSRRGKLMAEANRAFEEGNEEGLKRILREWETSPESVEGADVAAQLIRVLRKIAQVKERFRHIATEMTELRESDLYELKINVDRAEAEGQDVLAEMAARLEDEISRALERLKSIVEKKGQYG
jgi:DnaJ-domain-containing protein 1